MQKLTKLTIILLMVLTSLFLTACGPKETEEPTGPVLVSSVTLDAEGLTLLVGDTYVFEATVLPSDAANKTISYSTQKPNVATIDSSTGLLTAVAAGNVMITATSTDGSSKFDYVQVTVLAEAVELATPSNFVLTEDKLTWEAVSNALGYVILVNDVAMPEIPVDVTEYQIIQFNSLNTYKVKALGDEHTIISSLPTEAISAKILATPANFDNDEDTISWQEVEGAESYELWVNGATIDMGLATTMQLDLSDPRTYEIKVRAVINEENAYSSKFTESLEIIRLEVPTDATYQPGGIVWQAVPNAVSYSVSANEEEIITKLTNYKLPLDAEAKEYTFKVKAVGDEDKILDSVYSVEFVTTKLPTPQNLRIQEGKLMWDEVNLAQSYSLKINEQVVQVGQVTEFELLDNYPSGIYTVSVIANGNGDTYTNSSYSSVISATKLAATSQVSIVNGVITWLAVPNATEYVLTIDEQTFETSNTYFYAEESIPVGEHFVSISSRAENYLYSKNTSAKLVQKLSAPTNFRVENGVLVWSSVEYASSYEIVAGSNTYNSGDLNVYTLPLTGDNTYDIKIRTKGDNKKYLTSEFTEVLSATKLAKPQDIMLENGYITITPVANATSYTLEVNGVRNELTEEMFPYYLDGVGEEYYNIKLIAIGDDQYLNSDFSEILTVYQLPQVQDVVIANSNLTWNHIEGVNEYEVWIKAQENEDYDKFTDLYHSSTNVYDLTQVESGNYDIKVRARGDNLYDLVGVDSIELQFEKLATPTEFELKTGMLVWKNVANANSYVLDINGQSQEFTADNFYILDESYQVGNYSIKVAAYGDGANFITSEWTTEIVGDRLETPPNVRVVDGEVEWDSVTGATNYIINVAGIYYIGTVEEGVSTYVQWNPSDDYELEEGEEVSTRFETLTAYEAGIHNLIVYAVNENGFASIPSQPYTINKLNYPRNLRVEQGVIKWDAMLSGSNGYRLVINDDVIDTTDLSYDFTTYENYAPNNFKISLLTYGYTQIGDTNKVNSNYASSINIIVMQSPNNLRVLDGLINWVPVVGAIDYELLVYEKLGSDNYNLLTIDTPLLTGDVSNFLLGENYPAGEYGIKIRAIGDGSHYITSEFTNGYLDAIKLPTPTGLGLNNGKIIYDAVSNATGYQILANDVLAEAGAGTVYELEEQFLADVYDLSVRAVGDDVVYLTSSLSSSITATKLSQIENFRVEDGILKWTPNASANQYILYVNYEEYLIGIVTSYELPNEFEQGNYQVKIKARGTDNNLLNSNYTEMLDVYKMNTVTNLRVEDGVIKWDAPLAPEGYIEGAPNGYTITVVDSASQETKILLPSDATEYILSSDFSDGDYSIYVQTNGNSIADLNSVKMQIDVQKLQIPATIELKEDDEIYYLAWSQVDSTNTYRIIIESPDGTVDDLIDATNPQNLMEDPQNPGEYLVIYEVVAELEIGEHYVSVQAIGDNVSIVNSDIKAPITITKPSTPTNFKIENGMASWDASTYATEYKLSITFDDVLQPEIITTNTYYYLTDLGTYDISVTAYYAGSLPSEFFASNLEPYDFNMFSAGNGSQSEPFEITNETELRNVKYNPTAYYILNNSINLSTDNFEPIGTLQKPFIGNFNGDYYDVNGLTITNTYDYSGMFGYVEGTGVVENMYLNNVNITSASEYTGGVVGYNEGTINRVHITGQVKPTLNSVEKILYAGGITGYNLGEVQLSTATVQVEPINSSNLVYAGGIAGYNNGLISQAGTNSNSSVKANFAGGVTGYNNGNIEKAYNKGEVIAQAKSGAIEADGYAGGIAGYNLNTDSVGGYTGLIINSYNWGEISASSANASYAYAGGIVGYNGYVSASSFGEVKWSYSAGLVNATNTYNQNSRYAGGVAGYNSQGTKLIESYYLINTATTTTHGALGTDCDERKEIELKSSDFVNFLNNKNGTGSNIWTRIGVDNFVQLTWQSSL
jgi:hypothetical protein